MPQLIKTKPALLQKPGSVRNLIQTSRTGKLEGGLQGPPQVTKGHVANLLKARVLDSPDTSQGKHEGSVVPVTAADKLLHQWHTLPQYLKNFQLNSKIEQKFHHYDNAGVRGSTSFGFEIPVLRLGDLSPYASDSSDDTTDDEIEELEAKHHQAEYERTLRFIHHPRRATLSSPVQDESGTHHLSIHEAHEAHERSRDGDVNHPPTSILLQELLLSAKEERAEWFDYDPNSNIWTTKPVVFRKASLGQAAIPTHLSVREYGSSR